LQREAGLRLLETSIEPQGPTTMSVFVAEKVNEIRGKSETAGFRVKRGLSRQTRAFAPNAGFRAKRGLSRQTRAFALVWVLAGRFVAVETLSNWRNNMS
jgi:hypothetical protein